MSYELTRNENEAPFDDFARDEAIETDGDLFIEELEERAALEVHGACACTTSCKCSSCSCIIWW